jgi:hypothetical protein
MKNNLIAKRSHSIVIPLLTALVICTLVFTGCKNNEPENFSGNVSKPTWSVPSNYDYTSSMTAVIKVDLAAQYPSLAAKWQIQSDDLLAAFVEGECIGVATLLDNGLFNLYLSSPSQGSGKLTLRYYSAYFKNLFVATDAFVFKTDSHLGTVAAPFTPKFVVEK